MDTGQAKRTVIVGVAGAGAITSIDALRRGNMPGGRIAVGVAVSGAMLLVLAEFAPALAAGFGALILVTSAFVIGAPTWAAITKITK